MHSFEVHSHESACRKRGSLGLEQVTDNGIFNVSEFMEELLKKQQKIMFSGAGVSHQNRAA